MDKAILHRLNELLENEKAAEARQLLNDIPPEESMDYWTVKAKIEQKFQNWSGAINAWSKVLEWDETNVEAQNNSRIIRNILNFWNPEMFNP